MKISVPCLESRLQSASLPGRRSLRVAVWRPISFSRWRLRRSSARSTTQSRSLVACCGRVRQPVVEGIAHRVLDDAGGFRGGELVLGLALELRLADEHREHGGGRAHHVVGGDAGRRACCRRVRRKSRSASVSAERKPALVRAALGGRDGVAVGVEEAVLVGDPADRPFDRAVPAVLVDAAGEDVLGDARLPVDAGREVVGQAAGEVEARLRRRVVADERLARTTSGSRRRRTGRPWSAPCGTGAPA